MSSPWSAYAGCVLGKWVTLTLGDSSTCTDCWNTVNACNVQSQRRCCNTHSEYRIAYCHWAKISLKYLSRMPGTLRTERCCLFVNQLLGAVPASHTDWEWSLSCSWGQGMTKLGQVGHTLNVCQTVPHVLMTGLVFRLNIQTTHKKFLTAWPYTHSWWFVGLLESFASLKSWM